MTKKPYVVGYGKPPKETRFKPGQSGNPKGRTKGARGFDAALDHELKQTVVVTENGRSRKLRKRDVVIKTLVNQAMKGDARAIRVLIERADLLRGQAPLEISELETVINKRVVEDYRARILRGEGHGFNKKTSLVFSEVPTEAEVAGALMREDLASFITGAFMTVDGSQDFQPNWHIVLIADRLMRCYRREIKRLIITLPPRSLKSICASVAFPAWSLGQNPKLRFICASHSQELAVKHSRDCRTVMQTSWYKQLFPAAKLNPDKAAEVEFAMTAGGYRLSASVGGALTGRGGNFLIIDDPIKAEEANSEIRLGNAKRWFGSTAYTRLDNKKTDVIIIVMQRVHVDDLVAHVLETDGWDLLDLPAIAERDERFVLSDGTIVGRKRGDALHEEREPLEIIEQHRQAMGSFQFSAQYQQNPQPAAGNLLKRKWFQRYEKLPPRSPSDQLVQSWDVAMTIGGGSDWSVCTTWLVSDKRYYLLDVLRQRLEFPDLKRQIVSHARAHMATTILIEESGPGMSLIQQLKSEGQPRIIGVRPEGVGPLSLLCRAKPTCGRRR